MSTAPGSVMHIGELAERSGLSLRTLRHYDEIGLLTPSGRTTAGYREYTESDLERLLVIRRMKPLGYSLEQMATVLAAINDATQQHDMAELDRFIADAEDRRTTLLGQVAMADEFLTRLRSLRGAEG